MAYLWIALVAVLSSNSFVKCDQSNQLCPDQSWVSLDAGSCVKAFTEEKWYTSAKSYCHSIKGELMAIRNEKENKIVESLIKDSRFYFIGIVRKPGTKTVWQFSDKSKATYLPWAHNEPSSIGHGFMPVFGPAQYTTDCVAVNNRGEWDAVNCNFRNPFICKTEKDLKCVDKTWRRLDAKCYKAFPTYFTYNQARTKCQQFGADLVQIRNAEESRVVQGLMSHYVQYWMGITDPDNNNIFTYLNGDALTNNMWRQNEPQNTDGRKGCVEMRHDGKMDTASCFSSAQFVCEVPALRGGDKGCLIGPLKIKHGEAITYSKCQWKATCHKGNWIDIAHNDCVSGTVCNKKSFKCECASGRPVLGNDLLVIRCEE